MWICLYSYLLTYLLFPFFTELLQRGGLLRENYQGKELPLGMGIIILFVTGLSLFTTLPFYWRTWEREGLVFLFFLTMIGLLGLLDDVAGQENVKGLGGHLSFLLSEGGISTGLLKGIGGICGSFFVSFLLADSITAFLQGGILLSLSINTMNLLDLRPGRAVKAFFSLMAVALVCSGGGGPYFLFASVLGAVLAYSPFDFKGQVMMGDTGANVLGAAAGLALLWSLSSWQRMLAIVFFSLLHWYCERHSLSNTIKAIPLLDFFDRLGRPET